MNLSDKDTALEQAKVFILQDRQLRSKEPHLLHHSRCLPGLSWPPAAFLPHSALQLSHTQPARNTGILPSQTSGWAGTLRLPSNKIQL